MDPKNREIIRDSISDLFILKEKISDKTMGDIFQMNVVHLEFIKTLSSITIALVGIGYLYKTNLNQDFLLASLLFAGITLVFTISYIREYVDDHVRESMRYSDEMSKRLENGISVAVEAIDKGNEKIFFEFAKKESEKDTGKFPSVQSGEISVFIFFLSLGFLILSYFSTRYNFKFISIQTLAVFVFVYMLSFKSWALVMYRKLSKSIEFRHKDK